MLLAIAVLTFLLANGVSAAFADEGSFSATGGPSVYDVENAIDDPGVQKAEMPHTDALAAEELPHQDLNREQVNELFTEVFGPELQGPAGIFDELEVKKFYSDNVALIGPGNQPGGENAPEVTQPTLLEASLPLRTENAEGQSVAVDLDLEHAEGELQPVNPLVEVEVPVNLRDGISLPEVGVGISLANAPAERAPSTLEESLATYPNVAEDTSFAVAPTPTGVETLTLMQSADAPATQAFILSLPGGASLLESEDGGAEVRNQAGEPLLKVRPPSALDAAGQSVPVKLETAGDSVLVTAEPDQETSFPVLVDPMWETYYWYQKTTTAFQGWDSFSNSPAFTTSHNGWEGAGNWNPGLQIASGNGPITPGAQARWDYHVPRWATDTNTKGEHVRPTSYINRVIFEKLFFDVQAYANNPLWNDPFFAFYLWDENKQQFVAIGHRYGLEGNLSNMNYQYNLYNTTPPNENVDAKQTSLELVSSQTKGQYRQLYVGLAGVELSDKDFPSFSPLIEPEAWVNNTAKPITFTATDSGLGLKELAVTQPSSSGGTKKIITSYSPGCNGGAMSPCPREWTQKSGPAVAYDPASMPQGENAVTVDAADPLGHWSTQKPGAPAGTGTIFIDVDHTAPQLSSLSGTLTEQAKLGTNASQYTLKFSASDGDHEAPTTLPAYGVPGTGTGQFQRPMGIAVDQGGNIWVADRENNRIEKFDEAGNFLMQFGALGSGNGQFNDPRGIAVSSNGTIWVSDIGNRRVQAFNSNGEFIRAITYESFVEPYGLATGPGGVLWVSDPAGHRVYEFSEDGTLIRKAYGSPNKPTGESEINAPVGLATDSQGNLWVADNGANRITKFDANGKYAYQFGSMGTGNGQFQNPVGIAIVASGNLLVTDGTNNRVQEFQPSGTYLRQFGSTGSGGGQLKEPRGIAVARENKVLVADAGNRRVARWGHADYDPQSGVVGTEIKVDGQLADKYSPGCPLRDCAVSREWTLSAADYEPGQHNVEVIATDGVGLPTTKSLTVATVKDTTKPKLTGLSSYFTTPKGWVEQKAYSYSTSVSDVGGYGIASYVFKIDGNVVNSITQACPAGGCGASLSGTINMAAYQGGTHMGELVATDLAGNTAKAKHAFNVDPQGTVTAPEAALTLDAADTTSESTVVAPTVEVVDPAELEAGNQPGLQQNGEVLESTGTANQSMISVNLAEGFTIESSGESIHAEPVATNQNLTPAIVTEGVAATSANSAANVDTVIRPVFNGVFDYQSIRDSSAPEEYSWEVVLGKNQSLEQIDPEYVAVKYVSGALAYAIIADPAHDSVGTTIDTSLSVSGNVLTLTVPHKKEQYIYPVVSGVGWEGGFTTSIAQVPPPEITRSEKELEESVTNTALYMTIGPPEPAGKGDEEDATASSVHTFRKTYDFEQCEATVLPIPGCSIWSQHISGFFYYNGRYAWWKKEQPHPQCKHYTSPGYDIGLNYCDWSGPNHQPYGHGYHITSQAFYDVSVGIGSFSITKEHAITVRMFGSGGAYGHSDEWCVCNPSN